MKNNGRLFFWCLCFLTLCRLSSPCARGQTPDDPHWKDRFLGDAPVEWAQYQALSTRLQGSYKSKVFAEGHELLLETKIDFMQAPGCASLFGGILFSRDKASSDQECQAGNSKYSFRVKRRNTESPWIMSNIGGSASKNAPETFGKESTVYSVKCAVLAPIAIASNVEDAWPRMLEKPEFKVLSAATTREGEKELCVIEFDFQRSATAKNPVCVVGKGRVWFDVKLHWVMGKCEYKMQRGPKGPIDDDIATYRYDIGKDGFPLLKSVRLEHFDNKGKLVGHEESSYILFFGDPPERDFTLSAFGLPEPVGVTWPQPVKWWLWVSIASAVALVAAVALITLKRRYFSDSPPSAATNEVEGGSS